MIVFSNVGLCGDVVSHRGEDILTIGSAYEAIMTFHPGVKNILVKGDGETNQLVVSHDGEKVVAFENCDLEPGVFVDNEGWIHFGGRK